MNYLVIIVTSVFIFMTVKFVYTIIKDKQKKYIVLKLSSPNEIIKFRKYMTYNDDWEKSDNISIGNEDDDLDRFGSVYFMINNTNDRFNFNDKILNISGFYYYEKIINNVEKNYACNCIKIYILDDPNNRKMPQNILTSILDSKNSMVSLRHFITVNKCVYYNSFYVERHCDIPTLETKYIKSFFHQEKDQLWYFIKHRHLNKEFYENKGTVGNLSILLYGPPGSGKTSFIKRVAICLSLDISEVNLYTMPNSKINNLLSSNFPNKQSIHLIKNIDIIIEDAINKKIKNLNTDIVIKIIKGNTKISHDIIFSTTSNYNHLIKICPQLNNEKSIKQINIGYISQDTLQDISKFYFKQKIKKRLPSTIEIPTSQILELAMIHHINDGGFAKFQQEIFDLL